MSEELKRYSLRMALIATLAALLTGGKLALSFIPNVEIVSLIILLVTTSLGLKIAIPVIAIFTTTEMLIYGFGYWTIAYYIYWPALAIVIYLFNRRKPLNNLANAILVAMMSFTFGLLTTFVDTIFAGGLRNNFVILFGAIYVRGIIFYLVHVISNFIIVFTLYNPLKKAMISAINRMDYKLLWWWQQKERDDNPGNAQEPRNKHGRGLNSNEVKD